MQASLVVIKNYREAGIRRGYSWFLTDEQATVLMSQPCHYCELPPSSKYNGEGGNPYIHGGLDRKDNTKGYTVENTVPCCWVCNRMKGILPYGFFLVQIRTIYEHIAYKSE